MAHAIETQFGENELVPESEPLWVIAANARRPGCEKEPVVTRIPVVARTDQDRDKLFEVLPRLKQIASSIRDVWASGLLDGASGATAADVMCRSVLLPAQQAIRDYCQGFCQVLAVGDGTDDAPRTFFCISSPQNFECGFDESERRHRSWPLDALQHRFQRWPVERSHAGAALLKNAITFVPDLWGQSSQYDLYPQEIQDLLRQSGIAGLVVCPIRARLTPSFSQLDDPAEPVAVFQVLFPATDGLVDNPPTRFLIEMIVEQLSLLFQISIGIKRTLQVREKRRAGHAEGDDTAGSNT